MKITSITAQGFSLLIGFEAKGRKDLNRPESSCISVGGRSGGLIHTLRTKLTINRVGHYKGELTFPLILKGHYLFQYSCDFYDDMELGQADLPVVDVAYDRTGLVSVFAIHRSRTKIAVLFAATGSGEMRSPANTCLARIGGGYPTDRIQGTIKLVSKARSANAWIYRGVTTFDSTRGGLWIYSCSGYDPVDVPGMDD